MKLRLNFFLEPRNNRFRQQSFSTVNYVLHGGFGTRGGSPGSRGGYGAVVSRNVVVPLIAVVIVAVLLAMVAVVALQTLSAKSV